ncbi:Outer membrane cobalamin receptor protein [Chryseobacterium gleum]|uniref:Outer membrane cobalamin receptor protein n=2 Tax=Chryseobacterium gleum TaxID=250 RepID=A0A3S4MQJ7_CHRGE|nr:TonB-dependent receptor [Chryseobacterium gleum]EFK36295.1 TonB-dependent receptor [Chryseobacterium gleum ATCC 35910]QQY33541.1 TonB-dependent receptor plug domain-containing protein [Chryseobacterium gleum]VEE08532.1 Outer membrane cobalamin receptor protein [Chryseobacterium gleum]
MKKYIGIAALLGCTIAHAQQTQEGSIDEVNILGRKKIKQERAEFKRHAQSVETLSEEDLNRNNPAAIDQTLSTMPGLQVDKRTNFGGQRLVLRGYGNDQKFNNWGVKAYWNNMPLTNAEGITVLDDVDFAYVTNVEVIKGPAATMYGGGVGGAVRFYTRPDFTKGVSVSENAMFGAFKTFQSRTQLNVADDNYSVSAAYGHLETDGYRPNGGGLKNFFNVNGTVKLSKKDQLSFFASQAYSYEHTSGQISYADYYAGIDNGNAAYISKNAGTKIKSTRVGLSNSVSLTSNLRNYTTLFYYNGNTESVSAGAYGVTSSPNVGLRSTFTLKNEFKDFENRLDFGAEIQNSVSTTSSYRFDGNNPSQPLLTTGMSGASYFKYNNNQSTYFLIDYLTYKPWGLTLLAGISGNRTNYDRKDLFALPGLVAGRKDQSFNKKYDMAYTPHFALQKEWKHQIFNLSYSEGYNSPTAASSFITATNTVNDDLKPERAKMLDFSVHGLLLNTKLDYRISAFRIDYSDKLTQLTIPNSKIPGQTYWTNTGSQKNTGLEFSVGYQYRTENSFIERIVPFVNLSYYDAKYKDFTTIVGGIEKPYDHKSVVGVPRNKYAVGLDIFTKPGFYLVNTYNYLGNVYSDFNNENLVKGFGLLNSKLGFKKSFNKLDLDLYVMGNNLTNQINYTFLFLGSNINDSDKGSNYTVPTDLNPGPGKAYFFYGFNVKYRF